MPMLTMADNAKLGKTKEQPPVCMMDEKPKRPPRPLKPKKARPGLVIQIDDRDYQKIQDEADGLFKFWYCLNRLAFRKGNPFSLSYAVLRRETGSSDKQIKARTEMLEALRMLAVKRGKSSRTTNEYTILAGMYKDHSRSEKEE